MEFVKFTTITDVPVHYARPPVAPYGTQGKPIKYWRATPDFRSKLDAAFSELWRVCPLGRPNLIVSAGFAFDKPGLHGLGRAMDLDSIWWNERTWIALNYPYDSSFYLAIEAILKKHFGVVLSYLYNPAHRDHLHLNDSDAPGFSAGARSEVLFVQAALTHVFDKPVHTTGEPMPEMWEALKALNHDVQTKAGWLHFLSETARKGFAVREKEKTPLDYLHDLYTLIGHELEADERRKRVEAGLNVFTTDERTQKWLQQFR